MIAKISQVIQTICIAGLIWRTEIRGEESKNVRESNLVLHHLIVSLLTVQGGQVCVTPSVTPNLVTFIVHALDEGRVTRLRVIDLPFATVVPNQEECGFDPFGLEDVE